MPRGPGLRRAVRRALPGQDRRPIQAHCDEIKNDDPGGPEAGLSEAPEERGHLCQATSEADRRAGTRLNPCRDDNPIYENHLKPGYAVENGPDSIIITGALLLHGWRKKLLWLVSKLPSKGERNEYFKALSGLGMAYPQKIFDRLISLGVLREAAPRRIFRSAIKNLLQPSIRLIPAKAQEKFLAFFGPDDFKNLPTPTLSIVVGRAARARRRPGYFKDLARRRRGKRPVGIPAHRKWAALFTSLAIPSPPAAPA